MRKLFYYLMRGYIRFGFLFFFKSFKIHGKENLPGPKTAVIFLPNHQNTFLDALCVGVSNRRINHYMARADIFVNERVRKLASLINLRPIYRMRDGGQQALDKNEEVFKELISFLHQKHGVMLHPEGSHSLEYRLRPLKKGFIRIAFGAIEKHPELDLVLVPVGLNYSHHTRYRSNTSVAYGPPIAVRPYYEQPDRSRATADLRKRVSDEMKQLSLQIPADNYQEVHSALRSLNADFSRVNKAQQLVEKHPALEEVPPQRDIFKLKWFERPFYPLAYLNNILVILLWRKMKPTFKDPAWHGAIKFALAAYVAAPILILQSLLIAWLAGTGWAIAYLVFSVLTAPVLRITQN